MRCSLNVSTVGLCHRGDVANEGHVHAKVKLIGTSHRDASTSAFKVNYILFTHAAHTNVLLLYENHESGGRSLQGDAVETSKLWTLC